MLSVLPRIPNEFRKFFQHCHTLKRIINETQRSLEDISDSTLFPSDDLKQLLEHDIYNSVYKILDYTPTIVLFGQSCSVKALFINYLLDQVLLPTNKSTWRWIRICYGSSKRIRLTLGNEYEIVDKLKASNRPWQEILETDLKRPDSEVLLDHWPMVEIELAHQLLKEKLQIIIPPDCPIEHLNNVVGKNTENILPVILYVLQGLLNADNIEEIRTIKNIYPDLPILFIKMPSPRNGPLSSPTNNCTERTYNDIENCFNVTDSLTENDCVRNQLKGLGYIQSYGDEKFNEMLHKNSCFGDCIIDSCFICDKDIFQQFFLFVQGCLKSYLLKMAALLSEIHNTCLKKFILSAFDMAREIQITPRRIEYAQAREAELYKSLMKIADEKQEEITCIIQSTLQNMKTNVDDIVKDYRQDVPQNISTSKIQQLVLRKLCNSVATQLVESVDFLQDSFIGTLQRCLESLEKNYNEKEANLMASVAVKQILSAAYKVDLKSSTSFSVIHTFWERLRNVLYNIQLSWNSYNHFDPHHRRKVVATEIIESLCAAKLAKNISLQFKEHVKTSHEAFQAAMRTLESHLSGKLEQTEEQRINIRKYLAPRLAKLALESTSMCDMVRWGMPKTMKEIGRGQYGVVFACEPWGGIDPCAVKSVVPPDDRHWNDLAMEFYYTRTIPEHSRIVRLRGSIVDMSYSSSCSAVLLIMERMNKDLYCGLRTGLEWKTRLQIALDVVVGIRYLHSQGLVHRDIKLKNVLLDASDRAKLTDFGFCISEAMLSGSVVGTPVHMAPELLSGHYDSSVDVYAFGILFWYICAGHVRLPCVFEHFQNKEQLWSSVRKGIRPECLPYFEKPCWNLMEQCWAAEPSCRPLLGDVQPKLEEIMKHSLSNLEQCS